MNGGMNFNCLHLVKLHRSLFIRFLALDVVLGIGSAIFLLVPLTISVVSLNNLTLLVLIALGAVFFQMHSYRNCCGSISYYLTLPLKRTNLLMMLVGIGMTPIIFSLINYSGIVMAFGRQPQSVGNVIKFSDRFVYLFVVLTLIKVVPLPVAILYKKHVVLVPLFLFFLGFMYLSLSFIREMAGGIVLVSNPMMAMLFLCGVLIISAKIITDVHIE